MLSQADLQAASTLLWEHWRQGRRLPALPLSCRPVTRADGYAVQALIEQHTAHPLFGWKIAATSAAGQAHIGVDGPIAGRLLKERTRESGVEIALRGNYMRVAEPEFAFRMRSRLAPRAQPYNVEEVLAAVDSLHPAIEIPDSRYEDFAKVGAPQLIADLACAHLFVLGPPAPPAWRAVDLVEHRVMARVGGRYEREGKGVNVLGDPRVALTWIANELSGLAIALDVGQVVTTGTCMAPLEVVAGDHVTVDFGTIGRVDVQFGD
ncbi:MAG: hydratase [Proteobacteria bacterium]|nr:MAG: hydratase [Pseudomonadota bacterium]